MKLEYYYDNDENAKKSLRGGFVLAIIFTIIFIMSRKYRVEHIGVVGFIIECAIGVATALINYIINSIQR